MYVCVFDFDFMQNLGRRDMQCSPLCWHEPRSLPSQRRIPITGSLASRDSSQRAARGRRCKAPICLFPGL